ncbi:leucine-rich repeat-containing protein [Tanacetum coccineum]
MTSTPVFKLILSIFFSSIIIPSFTCPIHQKQALLHFKSTLTSIYNSKYSDKFVELDSWNPAFDCCSWERVNCSTTGSVTELHLSYVATPPSDFKQVPISSDILTPLFHIRSLERLDISYNYFEGEIPGDGFGNLTKLLHLDMWWNNFNGSIPSQLFQLTNLRYLDISDNYLEGKLGPEPGSNRKLTTLKSLEWLDVSANSYEGQIPGDGFGNLTKLLHLNMQGPIPAQLFALESLQDLDLANNKLGGGISPEIGRLTNLTFLDLRSNQFTGPIPSSMQNLSKLEYLWLNDNMLAGEIPTSLFKIRTLKYLHIGGKGSKLIWNNTTKVDPRCSLQRISMTSCGISGQIPEWISSQKELARLDLSGNELEGRFPHWLAEMNNIQSIILPDNNLNGQIPPRLFESDRLEVLDLSRNNFSGELPENIGNTTSIIYLMVSENHFSGLIPKSVSNLTGLQLLDLSRNRFSGNLPVLGADYLDLSDNDISGKIPANFAERTKILYLGGNKFAGSLPINLTKLVNLRVLDLHNSIITGNLQDILPQIPTLEILILRNTSLNGFIPNSISMCTSLRILDLSKNNLTRSIPRQMANLPLMSASSIPKDDLNEDQLQDLIVNWKKSSQRLRNLRFFVMLDLSGNNISGEIPASLGNLKALQQLNISHNKISGNIPLSLGNLVRIESLDVSHNQLSGSIPQSLGQLGNLTILDVSNNMLKGKIPRGRQMDTMNDLSYFQNNSGLCGMQIKVTCPGDIPSPEGRVEEEEDLSWMFWEGTFVGLVLSSCFVFLVASVGFIPWLPVKRDLCADDSGGFFLFGSLSVSTGFWFPGGVVSGLVGFCVSVSATSGSLLAVVDNAGLVGFIGIGIGFRAVEGGGCAAGVGRRSVGCCGGGVGKGNGGFWKTVSKTKSGLLIEVCS